MCCVMAVSSDIQSSIRMLDASGGRGDGEYVCGLIPVMCVPLLHRT